MAAFDEILKRALYLQYYDYCKTFSLKFLSSLPTPVPSRAAVPPSAARARRRTRSCQCEVMAPVIAVSGGR